jgi:hypothetical protein
MADIANKHYRGVPHASVIQRRPNQLGMGSCPYCQSVTYTGDTICYSCGRILASIRSDKFAMEQQFHKGSLDTTYKMTLKPTAGGVVQTHTGRTVDIMKNRRNKSRHVVLLVLVTFIMLAPQVRENVFEEWAPGLKEYIMLFPAEFHIYPNEATFTLDRTVVLTNGANTGWAHEDVLIPLNIESLSGENSDFKYTNGELPRSTEMIQELIAVNILLKSSEQVVDDFIEVPINGSILSYEDRLTTSQGHHVWWPEFNPNDNNSCKVSQCVKFEFSLDPGEKAIFSFQATVKSTSYSWWDKSSRVDSRIAGIDGGINVENSGTFEDLIMRGDGDKSRDFTDATWYDRGVDSDGVYRGNAINAQEDLVIQTAAMITSSLPENRKDNAYAYSRAAFDYLHEHITYDKNAPVIPRSGPVCLQDKTGDCDEQTNAFLSLLRVNKIPGWYVFGALVDGDYEDWEGHGWGYIQLPLKDSWCESRDITLDTCFVEASVDVVNNKWLLHTPNAYISWIEEPDSTGTLLNNYYAPGSYSKYLGTDRAPPLYTTLGDVDVNGGKYQVKILAEDLS